MRRGSRHALVVALGAVLGLGCAQRLRDSLSLRGVAILEGAQRVECFRVAATRFVDPTAPVVEVGGGEVAGRHVLATGKTQGPDFAARLAAVLLGDGVTRGDEPREFLPGVAFRVWKGKEAVEVLVSFATDRLGAHVVGEPGGAGDPQNLQDFAAARAALVRLAKGAFPNDGEIQGLPER